LSTISNPSVTAERVQCLSCGKGWRVGRRLSFYEQQAVESRPCPSCAAYTLCCTEGKTSAQAGAAT
jgi:hypothetical protein